MCASLLRFVAADDGRETSTKVDRRWRKKERRKERLKEGERGFPLSRLSLSSPSKEKKLGKKKVIKKKNALANGFQRAARLVLVLSADVHVGRHVRRRGHVLCIIVAHECV